MMGSLSFQHPISKAEVTLRRNDDNPFYGPIDAYRKSNPFRLELIRSPNSISVGGTKVPNISYIVPSNCPLNVWPAIELSMQKSAAMGASRELDVIARSGYLDPGAIDAFQHAASIEKPWVKALWREVLGILLLDDLQLSYLCYMHSFGRFAEIAGEARLCEGEHSMAKRNVSETLSKDPKDEFTYWRPTIREVTSKDDPGQVRIPGQLVREITSRAEMEAWRAELKAWQFLLILLKWDQWQDERTPFKQRLAEALELGLCHPMGEDNFRKICKAGGLLKTSRGRP